ncbi:MAG: tetratricopeptide repeat protein [Gemmataceae bacterium]|nr:tetratricopeptide repeat protein [Gemmataceae bacterium]
MLIRYLPILALLTSLGCQPTQHELVKDYHDDGLRLFQQGRFKDAQDSFQAALKLQPADPGIYFNLAETYDYLNRSQEAEKFYKECILRSPNHVGARHGLNALLVKQSRTQDAILLSEDWLKKQPALASAYAEDGWIWKQLGDLPRAQARYQQALSLDPSDTRTLVELAMVYEKLNRSDRSMVLYQRALEINPHLGSARQSMDRLKAAGTPYPHPD